VVVSLLPFAGVSRLELAPAPLAVALAHLIGATIAAVLLRGAWRTDALTCARTPVTPLATAGAGACLFAAVAAALGL